MAHVKSLLNFGAKGCPIIRSRQYVVVVGSQFHAHYGLGGDIHSTVLHYFSNFTQEATNEPGKLKRRAKP